MKTEDRRPKTEDRRPKTEVEIRNPQPSRRRARRSQSAIRNPILLFDGVCNLCNSLVKFVIRRDKKARIRFASLQSTAGQSLLSKAGLKSGTTDTVIYFTDNNYSFRSSAVLNLLRDIGGVSKLFYAFIIIPLFIRDFFYTLVARSRYRIFGRRQSCMVPSKDIENRFIL